MPETPTPISDVDQAAEQAYEPIRYSGKPGRLVRSAVVATSLALLGGSSTEPIPASPTSAEISAGNEAINNSEIEISSTPFELTTDMPVPQVDINKFNEDAKAEENRLAQEGFAEKDPQKQAAIFAQWRATVSANSKKSMEYSAVENSHHTDLEKQQKLSDQMIESFEASFVVGVKLPNGLRINFFESSQGSGNKRSLVVNPKGVEELVESLFSVIYKLPDSEYKRYALVTKKEAKTGRLSDNLISIIVSNRSDTCVGEGFDAQKFVDTNKSRPVDTCGAGGFESDKGMLGKKNVVIVLRGPQTYAKNGKRSFVEGNKNVVVSSSEEADMLEITAHEILHGIVGLGAKQRSMLPDGQRREHEQFVNPGTERVVSREYYTDVVSGKKRPPFSFR